MGTRQISNKRNIICVIVGVVMILISSIEIMLSILHEKRKWPDQNIDLLFLLLGIAGIILIIFSIVNINSNIEMNKCLKNFAYGLDFQKEFSTYKIIGKKKKVKSGTIKKYNKYSEWKKHVEETFGTIKNNEDAYRFMVRELRSKESYKELIIAVVIPVEVGMFSVFYSAGIDISELGTILSILVSAILLLVMVTVNYLECKDEIDFISDFMEIIFSEVPNQNRGPSH
jgi:hypothetical protein